MKAFSIFLTIVLTALIFSPYAVAEESTAPPIAQPLVREGEFARQLVEALKMTPAQTEAEAENMLTAAGIVPQKGWIADYPVTPDILSELEKSVKNAASSGAIGLKEDEALQAFQDLKKDVGLGGVKDPTGNYAESEPPPSYEGDSSSGTVVNNYYVNEGPPVVTYYPPPYDYYGLYGWVPYPFWHTGFFFSGFFILRDFHRPIFVHKKAFIVSNHFFDGHVKKVITVAPHKRFLRETIGHDGASLGVTSGRAGIQNRGNLRGNAGLGANRVEGSGRGGGTGGSAFQTRGSGNDRGQPTFRRGSARGGERFSGPGRTSGNPGETIRPSGGGSGGSSNSTSRQDRGGSSSFSGSGGRSFENRGFNRGGSSGGGSSIFRQDRGGSRSFSGSGGRSFENRGFNRGGSSGSGSSIIRQDRGGSRSFSGSGGRSFENRGFNRGGSSGSGSSLKGFGGGGGRGSR